MIAVLCNLLGVFFISYAGVFTINTIIIDLYNIDVDKKCYLLGCTVVAHNDGPYQLLQQFHLHYLDTYARHFPNCQQSAKNQNKFSIETS